jgi:uncharacterized membrane protein
MDFDDETGNLYMAAYNGSSGTGEFRIVDVTTGNSTLIAAFPGGAEVDSLAFRTGGEPVDIKWLSEVPTEGFVDADSTFEVDVIFDTTVLTQTGTYTGTLKVTTDDEQNKTIFVPVTLTVVEPFYGVDLSPETDAMSGAPGETVDYTLQLTNMGNVQDTFDLSVSGNTWDVVFPVNPVTVDPGATVDVTVSVTIPPDAMDGDTDEAVITATSQEDPTQSDSSTLTTTAEVMIGAGVDLTPSEDAGSGKPGETVEYTLQLTNLGTAEDTITLEAYDNLWDVTLSGESFTLAAGESVDVDVYVTIPMGTEPGATDMVTIEATSGNDPSVTAESVLTTTAEEIVIYLTAIFRYEP